MESNIFIYSTFFKYLRFIFGMMLMKGRKDVFSLALLNLEIIIMIVDLKNHLTFF